MSRKLSDLSPEFQPLAVELIRRAQEAGIYVTVIDTRRTPEEQAEYIKRGVSWTKDSRHLTGHAIDLCPNDYLRMKGWNPGGPLWLKLGEVGEALKLRWGGRFAQRDYGHFEMPRASVTNKPWKT